MRHHLAVLLCVTGWYLMGGCSTDATKSPSDTPSSSPIAQAQEGTDQPPSGEVQERAVPRMAPGAGIAPPQMLPPRQMAPIVPTPPPTGGPSAGRLGPSGIAAQPGGLAANPGPPNVGPTPNITAVANAFMQYHKSLTILLTIAPGLTLTQAVTISVGIYSPAGGQPNRITQTYTPATGNHFLWNDNEGDGHLRHVHMDITLTEPKPGGGQYSYNLPVDLNLDPLYDVKIDPLNFLLLSDCADLGASTVTFSWLPPDVMDNSGGKDSTFHSGLFKSSTIFDFAWSRAEVSASANLHMPVFWFTCRGSHIELGTGFCPLHGGSTVDGVPNLVPGHTQTVKGTMQGSCTTDAPNNGNVPGEFAYTTTYTLRWYPYLVP